MKGFVIMGTAKSFDHTVAPMVFYQETVNSPDEFVPLNYPGAQPNRYVISRDGRIYDTINGVYKRTSLNRGGYDILTLHRDGLGNTGAIGLHRCVATAYVINDDPEDYTDVNHIDGNKHNNHYDNLEWCNNNQNKWQAALNGQYEHGEDRYNAVYSDAFAHELCQMFQSGIPYLEVYQRYVHNRKEMQTIGSFIYKIYHRKARRHVTQNYTW